MKTILSVFVLTLILTLPGCATGPKEEVGMVIGGVLGGVLGSQVGSGRGRTTATVIGALAGSAIGGSIGREMDELDRMKMSATLETTRTGVATTWTNPDTGYDYRMEPTRTYESAEGPCREYVLDAEIGGRTEQVYGTACRQADGSWRIVD
ncbi:glycine zipper 2TM domain-containing protein [Wenzhouxiangella sp. 15190]|uniref:glycine zipper 2TM domain-containing protein n=1 Tax=Wenzhouxiangella sp. 15190 TaxID=2301225 RepID=UPI002164D2F8|nr:glycine zipper 2TM domain-containing protein [Wenzhouxiangella sp. 15190]